MTPLNDDIPVAPALSRRTVAVAAAWTAPVVAVTAAAPQAAASSDVSLRILSATLVDDAERPVTIVPASGVIGVPVVAFDLTAPGAGDDRVRIDVAPVRAGDVTVSSGAFPISWISATSPSSPSDGAIIRGALVTGDVLELRVTVTLLRDPAVTASALITVPTATAVIWGMLDAERRP